MRITLYTGDKCSFCACAKQLLDARGQVLVDCEPIGGFAELSALIGQVDAG
jgi:glutaredoxin